MVETQKKVEELKKVYLSWSLHDSDVRREGRKEGIAIGEKRGEERAKFEAARNFLMENIPENVIARCTGLPVEKVRELAEELQSKA